MFYEEGLLYQFHESPVLKLSRYFDDVEGRSGYIFDIFQSDVIGLNKAGTPALSVTLKDGNVFAIKVYDFSFPGESASFFVYKGLLPSGVGLGGKISELLPFTVLEFDSGNEWFITDEGFGLVEVSGWGVPLDERIDLEKGTDLFDLINPSPFLLLFLNPFVERGREYLLRAACLRFMQRGYKSVSTKVPWSDC